MTKTRSLIRAGSVLAVALAVGHLVQTMTAYTPNRAEPAQDAAALPTGASLDPATAPQPTAITPVQASTETAASLPRNYDPLQQAAAACADRLTLAAAPGALITVMIHSPCRAGERVVLRHAGLVVAERFDAEGRFSTLLPAFNAGGEVSVLLADGGVLRDEVAVTDLGGLRRFGVQWVAADEFQLQAPIRAWQKNRRP